jgi:hypothetical protein
VAGTLSVLYFVAFEVYAAGMQISDGDLEEFRSLYAKEFGEQLLAAESAEMASRLADLYSLLAESLPSELESN